jgi:hypothetical protein
MVRCSTLYRERSRSNWEAPTLNSISQGMDGLKRIRARFADRLKDHDLFSPSKDSETSSLFSTRSHRIT